MTAVLVAPLANELAWEVDLPDGSPLYRGRDIELAHQLYESAPPGSHLIPAPPETTALSELPLPGGDE